MSDNRRVYRTIRKAIKQFYPQEPKGNTARHLNTLSALVAGIVQSKRSQLPAIAGKIPENTNLESRVKKYSRWFQNNRIDSTIYYLPFVTELLTALAEIRTLVLVMDGSEIGHNCLALMLSVVYKGRTLPVAWLVVQGKKGHFSAEKHIALLQKVHRIIPESADVVFLGDGEFDSVELQKSLRNYGWDYVCRTAENIIIEECGEEFSFKELSITVGDCLCLPQVLFTKQKYGPVQVIAWWQTGYIDPIFLVTNLVVKEEACYWYKKRFRIETFFSDEKSRGFHIQKSHISDPERLNRLLIAACLAYLWIVYLGTVAQKDNLVRIIHRSDRCDLSLFQLGLRLLDYFLNHEKTIPVAFKKPTWILL